MRDKLEKWRTNWPAVILAGLTRSSNAAVKLDDSEVLMKFTRGPRQAHALADVGMNYLCKIPTQYKVVL